MVEGQESFREIFSARTLPHKLARYETTGDWMITPDGKIEIAVSSLGNRDYEFLVAIHELVEAYLCDRQGVTDEAVTAFDEAFEAARLEGDMAEPGDSVSAPYRNQHCAATAVERTVCAVLGLSWQEYESACQGLSQ